MISENKLVTVCTTTEANIHAEHRELENYADMDIGLLLIILIFLLDIAVLYSIVRTKST